MAEERPSRGDILQELEKRSGLSPEQVRAFLQSQAELAWKCLTNGSRYPIAGIGELRYVEVPAYKMVMPFGPRKGQLVEVPHKRRVKFSTADATRDVVLGKNEPPADVCEVEWYTPPVEHDD